LAKLSRKRAEMIALSAILLHVVLAAASFALVWAYGGRSASSFVLSWQLVLGIPFWFLSLLYIRQQRMAAEEEIEWDRLLAERKAKGGEGALFEVEEGEAFLQRHRLQKMERWWLQIGSLVVFLALGGACFLLFRAKAVTAAALKTDNALIAAGYLAAEAFALFLFGMYAGGMAKEKTWRDLRAGASFTMFCFASSLATLASVLLANYGFPHADVVVAIAINVLFGLLALEILLNFVINIYRPRLPGAVARYAYDSRWLELVTHPSSILRTVASTLDYQFGFKVSDTWFYRFLEQAIAPILLFGVIMFYLMTCLTVVSSDQRGVIERLDGSVRVVGPGLHLKRPWPFEQVCEKPASRLLEISAGYLERADSGRRRERLLWTAQHFEKEYNILVAMEPGEWEKMRDAVREGERPTPPVNFITCNLTIQYQIGGKDPNKALQDYIYNVSQPDRLLHSLAYRELTKYMASVDFFKVMCQERQKANDELKQSIQAAADKEGLGIEVVFVGLVGVHPPVGGEGQDVGRSFEMVVAEQENVHATTLQAEAEKIRKVKDAEIRERTEFASSMAYRYVRDVTATSVAERFASQLAAYNAAPGVYEVRLVMDALEESIPEVRKYVVAAKTWDWEMLRLNWEESQMPSIMKVKVGEEAKENKENKPK
jgi:modulator of FtsH protease HflK